MLANKLVCISFSPNAGIELIESRMGLIGWHKLVPIPLHKFGMIGTASVINQGFRKFGHAAMYSGKRNTLTLIPNLPLLGTVVPEDKKHSSPFWSLFILSQHSSHKLEHCKNSRKPASSYKNTHCGCYDLYSSCSPIVPLEINSLQL